MKAVKVVGLLGLIASARLAGGVVLAYLRFENKAQTFFSDTHNHSYTFKYIEQIGGGDHRINLVDCMNASISFQHTKGDDTQATDVWMFSTHSWLCAQTENLKHYFKSSLHSSLY